MANMDNLLEFDWLFQLIMQHLKLDDRVVNIQQYNNKKKFFQGCPLHLCGYLGSDCSLQDEQEGGLEGSVVPETGKDRYLQGQEDPG